MMAINVPMMSVMGLEPVHILITMIRAMTDCFAMVMTPAMAETVLPIQETPVLMM